MRLIAPVGFAALALLAACANEGRGEPCAAGLEIPCECLDAPPGTRVCSDLGIFSACDCANLWESAGPTGDDGADAAAERDADDAGDLDGDDADDHRADAGPPTIDAGSQADAGETGDGPLTCTAQCRVRWPDHVPPAPWINRLNAGPGDELECRAIASDPTASVRWSLAQVPPASTSVPEPLRGGTTTIALDDTLGTYVVAATCRVDAQQTDTSVDVSVSPMPAFTFELAWSTPGDDDPDDRGFGAGADLDLHVLHLAGCWGDEAWDCFYRTDGLEWNTGGTCGMDIDIEDGRFPEFVTVDNPSAATFRAGAHYYADYGYGESTATLRIYLSGRPHAELVSPPLQPGQWWVPAQVSWPSLEIAELGPDVVYDDVPPCDW